MSDPHVWIGTSWKMNKTLAEAMVFAEGLAQATVDPRLQAFVIPPFTAVREVKAMLATTEVGKLHCPPRLAVARHLIEVWADLK